MNGEVNYFTHDRDMRHDPKINALRTRFPGWGYSAWNMLLEQLCDSHDRAIAWDELNRELVAADFGMETDMLVDIVDYCIHLHLLQLEDGTLKCQRFEERFETLDRKRASRQTAGIAGAASRWGKNDTPSGMAQNGKNMANDSNAIKTDGKAMAKDSFAIKSDGNAIENDNKAMAKVENVAKPDGKKMARVEKKRKDYYYYSSSSLPSSSLPEASEEEESKEEQQQKIEILFDFFFRNFLKPEVETAKFWAWNNSSDRTWSKLDDLHRRSALDQWKQKPEQKPRFEDKFLRMWREIVDMAAGTDVLADALSDNLAWDYDKKSKGYCLTCSPVLYGWMEDNIRDLREILIGYYPVLGDHPLQYNITDKD